MISLQKDNLSDKIAAVLEKQISSGRLVPGRKLPSTRDLARQYDVSQQVIKSAVEMLEKRNLVLRQPRIGIYVKPGSVDPQKREICLLTLRTHEHVTDYPAKLLAFNDASLWRHFNLNTRTISGHAPSPDAVRYEIEKLREARPDCLLVFMPLNESTRRSFLDLPFPVVFLGDFNIDLAALPAVNQIVEDTAERAAAMVATAAEAGASSVVLIAGPLERGYCRTLRDAALRTAVAAGIDFNYFEFTDGFCATTAEVAERRRDAIIRLLERHPRPGALLFDGFRELRLFTAALADRGLVAGRDLLLVADGEMSPGAIYLQSDCHAFADAALVLIRQLIAAPDQPFGRRVLSGLIRRHGLRIDAIPTVSQSTIR